MLSLLKKIAFWCSLPPPARDGTAFFAFPSQIRSVGAWIKIEDILKLPLFLWQNFSVAGLLPGKNLRKHFVY